MKREELAYRPGLFLRMRSFFRLIRLRLRGW